MKMILKITTHFPGRLSAINSWMTLSECNRAHIWCSACDWQDPCPRAAWDMGKPPHQEMVFSPAPHSAPCYASAVLPLLVPCLGWAPLQLWGRRPRKLFTIALSWILLHCKPSWKNTFLQLHQHCDNTESLQWHPEGVNLSKLLSSFRGAPGRTESRTTSLCVFSAHSLKLLRPGATDPNWFCQLPNMLEDGANQTEVAKCPLPAFKSAQTQHAKSGKTRTLHWFCSLHDFRLPLTAPTAPHHCSTADSPFSAWGRTKRIVYWPHPLQEASNLPLWKVKSQAVQKGATCLLGKLKSTVKERKE